MAREIIRYYRKEGRIPRGCVIALIDGDEVRGIGFSLYNRVAEKKNGIPFTKERARLIARARANKGSKVPVPSKLQETYDAVVVSCELFIAKSNATEEEC